MKRWIETIPRLLLPALLAMVTGCVALPDLTPYSDSLAYFPELQRVGKAVAKKVKSEYFASF